MSTSDRQDQGPLTRKQLREIRLTGSTPVITPEEAAAAAAAAAPPVPPLPRAAEPAEIAPAPTPEPDAPMQAGAESGATPLTRRQVRERERGNTESVPVVGDQDAEAAAEAPDEQALAAEATPGEPAVDDEPLIAPVEPLPEAPGLVTAVPAFTPAAPADADVDDDDADDDVAVPAPVSASAGVDSSDAFPFTPEPSSAADDEAVAESKPEDDEKQDVAVAVAALGIQVETPVDDDGDDDLAETDDVLADVDEADDSDITEDERPTVSPAFGQELLSDPAETKKPFVPSFDELLTVGDSTGSQHLAPNTLIFTPSPGDGSLSGPVASTGEILVTGSYELPKGLGSQGHAHGTTDGKDVDAVLIDGELPPASSPTPIAASSAVSTIKPAGEVIRPPAPEKGNKLMLILAIVAGGLALALGVSLIVAFSMNVF